MKFLSFIMSILMSLSALFGGNAMKGDVNGDKKVNSADALMILQYEKGQIDLTKKQLKVADMNGDGIVDKNDANAILEESVQ